MLILPAEAPAADGPPASSTGTWMKSPLMSPPVWLNWLLAMATSVLLSMASTKPSPSVFSEVRKARTSLPPRMRS
jgi:hypothetical protein